MKKIVRTLDFYGYDDGCTTKDGSKFLKNTNNSGSTISKNSEYNVVGGFSI